MLSISLTHRLLQLDLEKISKAYDGFLGEFPLCYVYWKKYADHMGQLTGNVDENAAVRVYERAVCAAPHCVEIWAHYCTHLHDRVAAHVALEHGQAQ
jgi:pre-mRNA-processing factor 39